MARHFILNRNFILTSQTTIKPTNNGLLFGDCFSFVIRGCSSKMFFSKDFFDYLLKKVADFKMVLPIYYSQTVFEGDIKNLLYVNRIYQGFEGIVSVYRNENEKESSVLCSVEAIENQYYKYNKSGILLNSVSKETVPELLFKTKKYPFLNYFNNLENNLILTDELGNIVQVSNANIFFVRNNVIFVPKRQLKNAELIIVKFVISLLKEKGYSIVSQNIKEEDLKSFDEVFVVSLRDGIKWVMGYKSVKRYYHNLSAEISSSMDEFLKKIIENGK